jgi:hypothetical protein
VSLCDCVVSTSKLGGFLLVNRPLVCSELCVTFPVVKPTLMEAL